MNKLILIGAGGHGKVVADSAALCGNWRSIEFLDDAYPELSRTSNWQVIGKIDDYANFIDSETQFTVSIGQNIVRLKIIEKLHQANTSLPVIAHPSAFISDRQNVGDATVVMAQAAINVDCKIGQGCIINTGATVDHDCNLADGVHISPGAHLAGGVSIGKRSSIGIGAVVTPGVKIGENVIVGAGSTVLEDIEDGTTVIGNPARSI